MELEDFTVNPVNTIYDALKKVDANKKGFLIVIDNENLFLGTLTDGDIRRAFIKGTDINDTIETIYNKDSVKIYWNDEFSKVIEIFKSSKIEFLPIINEADRLTNIITKSNMHILLLSDICFDFNYDFINIEDALLEYEIYNRPWGLYKTTFINDYAQSKIIKINPLGILSLQEHKCREEYWVVINGNGEVTIGESVKRVEPGDFLYIPKGCKHRLQNVSDTESLMIAEVQIGDYFGEDDIIRYEDFYGRKCVI